MIRFVRQYAANSSAQCSSGSLHGRLLRRPRPQSAPSVVAVLEFVLSAELTGSGSGTDASKERRLAQVRLAARELRDLEDHLPAAEEFLKLVDIASGGQEDREIYIMVAADVAISSCWQTLAVVPADDESFAPWYSRGSEYHRRARLLAGAERRGGLGRGGGPPSRRARRGGRNGEVPRTEALRVAALTEGNSLGRYGDAVPASPRVSDAAAKQARGCRPRHRISPPGVPLTHLLNRSFEGTLLEPRPPRHPTRGPGRSCPGLPAGSGEYSSEYVYYWVGTWDAGARRWTPDMTEPKLMDYATTTPAPAEQWTAKGTPSSSASPRTGAPNAPTTTPAGPTTPASPWS